MATGSIAVYEAGEEVASSEIGSFAEGTSKTVTVTLPLSANSPFFTKAAENGTRFQSVSLTMGTFNMTYDNVMFISFDVSGITEHATTTFSYESAQP
jgi:hypothetical protein